MSYPQPLASQEVLEGQEFFRLLTRLSEGDVYELDVSAKAFVIGPESDVHRCRVTYYDPSQANRSASAVVSVGNPFIGRVDRLASSRFPVSNTPANILVTAEDLVSPSYNIVGSLAPDPADIRSFVSPKIDILAYFDQPSNIPRKRAPFRQNGRLTILNRGAGTGKTYLSLPFYGRKYSSIKIVNIGALIGYTIDILGVSLTTQGATYPAVTSLVTAQAISAGAGSVTEVEIKASTDGLHDFLCFIWSGNAVDSSITLSSILYTIEFDDEEV